MTLLTFFLQSVFGALSVLSALVFLPSFVFFAECAAAFLPERRGRERTRKEVFRTVVLIPAHDEAPVIGATLHTLAPELGEHDAVLVVADNCSDRTADIAREAGALVIERTCADKRGKGFALDFGFRHLAR